MCLQLLAGVQVHPRISSMSMLSWLTAAPGEVKTWSVEPVTLAGKERAELERRVRTLTTSHRGSVRAEVILSGGRFGQPSRTTSRAVQAGSLHVTAAVCRLRPPPSPEPPLADPALEAPVHRHRSRPRSGRADLRPAEPHENLQHRNWHRRGDRPGGEHHYGDGRLRGPASLRP